MSTRTAPHRVVAYVRVSKDRHDETSTETQEAAARSLCAAHGWQMVEVVVERGRSAYGNGRQRRPGLLRARQLIEAGAADVFMVWKLDRAARNTLDLLELVEWLRAQDAQFVSVTERFDTTSPTGELLLTILAALARMESATKADRTRAWLDGRAERRETPVGPPATGYRRPAPNELELDPVVAPIMRAAALAVLDGTSITQTVRDLAAQDVIISRRAFRSWLRSPTPAGYLTGPNGQLIAGDWPAIVERDDWARLQDLLSDPQRNLTRGVGSRRQWSLSGIARCGRCDKPMRAQRSSTRQPRLVCRTRGCKRAIVYANVEAVVEARVLAAMDDHAWAEARARGRVAAPAPQDLEQELAQLWQLVVARRITIAQYDEAAAEWEGLAALADAEPLDLPDVESARDAWPTFTPAERFLLYQVAVRSLHIDGGDAPERVRLVLATGPV